jgi:pectin methylesterase-like acyl-CoA thioesterase
VATGGGGSSGESSGSPGTPTPEAATFVVSPTPGVGDFTTIQDALDALPAEGGKILIREGTYPITTEIQIPNKQVFLDGCGTELAGNDQGTVIDLGANAINAFRQLGSKHIKVANLHVIGADDIVQTFWHADNPDGSNFVDFVNVTVDFMQNGFANPAGFLFVRLSQFYMTNEDNDGDDSPGISFNGTGSMEGMNSQINGGNITGSCDIVGADFNLILDNCVVSGPNQIHFLFLTDSYISGQIKIISGGIAHIEGCHFVQLIGTPDRYLDFDVGAGPSSVIG